MTKGPASGEELCDKWLNKFHSRSNKPDILPTTVYHYTNSESLVSILSNGTMFATDYRFLNDKTEISHGVARAENILQALRATLNSKFVDEVKQYTYLDSAFRSFVVSFSSKSDDLSQWRGYAHDGEGFTLGFSTHDLIEKSIPSSGPFIFGEVNYSDDSLKSDVFSIVGDFSKNYTDGVQSSDTFDDYSSWCGSTVTSACSFHKHNSFRFEEEWRIVDVIPETEGSRIKVRSRGNSLIPYVEVNLKNHNGKLPLTHIGIGPGFNHRSVRNAVEDLCTQYGHSVQIYEADTPYIRS